MSEDGDAFPWYLGVYDAHCHPTDVLSSLELVPGMKAQVLTIMATRAQDQDLVSKAADEHAVSPDLGQQQHPAILPSYGWHPWFAHHLHAAPSSGSLNDQEIREHYRSVLTPAPDPDFLASLPPPIPLDTYIAQARAHLEQHPLALVGEIGLDRAIRLPMPWDPSTSATRDVELTPGGREGRRLSPYRVQIEHQRTVLLAQLRLAAELQRPASVHGVQCHGILYDTLAEAWNKGQCAPRVCLHSYSGPVEGVKRYTAKKVPVKVWFSFSVAVNWMPHPGRTEDVIRAVPDDRLLVESDLHTAGKRMDDALEDVVRRICQIKGWELSEGVRRLGSNYREFILGTAE